MLAVLVRYWATNPNQAFKPALVFEIDATNATQWADAINRFTVGLSYHLCTELSVR